MSNMKRIHFLLVVLGIVTGLAIAQLLFPRKSISEAAIFPAQWLRTELDFFAPKLYSERNEEVIIRHFFKDRRAGIFLDVGAYHYRNGSNTYYLEKKLGWSGIAIDANNEFALGYERNRPNTKFFSFFVSDKSDEQALFYLVRDPGHLTKSTAVPSFINGRETEEIHVPTITLNDLLIKLGMEKIDFFSIDIELWEPYALAGFNIEKFQPELVCIEAHHQVRDQIFNYFTTHGYVRLDLYFLFDQRNWYFVPKSQYQRLFNVSY